ncbi:hypothetical protein BB558_002566 [Smittium angustum]|uniref:Uncharacterized protein n=1 Tax=Smittium angustum TaxID=133377 RepID=A0A2U1J8A1_SMIAN|nr:hypothetical protein BB558_002566 [Smittium angustum]
MNTNETLLELEDNGNSPMTNFGTLRKRRLSASVSYLRWRRNFMSVLPKQSAKIAILLLLPITLYILYYYTYFIPKSIDRLNFHNNKHKHVPNKIHEDEETEIGTKELINIIKADLLDNKDGGYSNGKSNRKGSGSKQGKLNLFSFKEIKEAQTNLDEYLDTNNTENIRISKMILYYYQMYQNEPNPLLSDSLTLSYKEKQQKIKMKYVDTNNKTKNFENIEKVGIVDRIERVNGAFVALVRNSELIGMQSAVRQIEDRFNNKFNYPYIFLNDKEFTQEFKSGIRSITKANVTFGLVEGESWGYPYWIDIDRADEEREYSDYVYGDSESYRFMCRFQSGYIFRHPLVENLDYYWRIEPDVKYYCDIDYDPFLFMKENKLVYGFNMALEEIHDTIPTLWNTTKEFMTKNPHLINPENNFLNWITKYKNKKRNEKRENEQLENEYLQDEYFYNGCHFWSNFEIVDLSFYRSEAYLDYFDYLDYSGGFFYERWGDAPIHTIAAAMFLKKEQVHFFRDIGYYHPDLGYCPEETDRVGACSCDSSKNVVYNQKCRRKWDI